MNRIRLAWLTGTIFLTGSLGGWVAVWSLDAMTDESALQRAIVVRGPVVARMAVAGTLLPRYRNTLSFTAPGRVSRVDVQVRERVVTGQPLAALDAAQLIPAVRRREFDLERATLRARAPVRTGTDEQEAQARLSELDVEQAAFELALARAQIDAATLRSPVEGTVAHIGVQVGDMVGAGGSGAAHFIIARDDEYVIEIEGDEGEMRRARPGAPATIFLAPPDAAILPGVVDGVPSVRRISAGAAGATTLVITVALSRNPDDVQIGRTARVEIDVDSRTDVPVVPLQALFRHDNRDQVLVWQEGRWIPTPVTLGLADEFVAEIIEGPLVGAVIATGPSQRLRRLASPRRP